jgi:tetratricopeptide (TPR) repeat protein
VSGYTTQDVARMIGVSAGRLRSYLRAGVLTPERGTRGELRFSFQDLLLLRKAEGLVRERIPPHSVRRALQKLRARLPSERPLTGVQLAAEGRSVVVHEDGARWQVESGQVLLAFDGGAAAAAEGDPPVDMLRKLDAATPEAGAARPASRTEYRADVHPELVPASLDEIYEVACALDDTDPVNAEAGYREVLDQNPDHADAHINLGRILHERGELGPAEGHYQRALAVRPHDPTATFNIGVVLEDQGRHNEALDAYRRAIAADPRNADAHYNAARLYDQLGDYGAALRHLRICRDLARHER